MQRFLRTRFRRVVDSYIRWNWDWNFDAAMRYVAVKDEILQEMHNGSHLRICDVGCGTRGGITGYARIPVIGVDLTFEPNIIKRFPSCTPVTASGLALPFSNGTFDVAICLDVLEHLPVDHRPLLLDEVFRITAPDGWVFIGAPCGTEVREAECHANALYRARTGLDHPWLVEHLRNAPLDCAVLEKQIIQAARQHLGPFEIKSFFNMSLRLWQMLRSVLWTYPWLLQGQRLLLSPWFGWLKRFQGPPSYRRIWSVRAIGWKR